MPSHRLSAWLLAAGATTLGMALSCRTTKPEQDAVASAPKAAVSQASAAGVAFSAEDEQGLYAKMRAVETARGAKSGQDQLHTARGVVECHQGSGQAPCLLRVRLGAEVLSSSQPVAKPLAAELWRFAKGSRPELAGEPLVLMTLLCDYIGKKSPPYDVSSVHCGVSLPRASDEAVFSGKAAEELSEAIRGEQPYGPSLVQLSGAVSCQWLKASPRTPCIARAQVGGVLLEKITEMSAGVSAEVARSLKQATLDHASVEPGVNGEGGPDKAEADSPQEIVATLSCLVDNTKGDPDGRRTYSCRAKI